MQQINKTLTQICFVPQCCKRILAGWKDVLAPIRAPAAPVDESGMSTTDPDPARVFICFESECLQDAFWCVSLWLCQISNCDMMMVIKQTHTQG